MGKGCKETIIITSYFKLPDILKSLTPYIVYNFSNYDGKFHEQVSILVSNREY